MAIRVTTGTVPPMGRLTMPKGTFLSNPSTAAVGSLGGPQGMNPALGQTPDYLNTNTWGQSINPLGTEDARGNAPANPFQGIVDWFASQKGTNRSVLDVLLGGTTKAPISYGQNTILPSQGFGVFQSSDKPVNAFAPPKSKTNTLVGQDIGSSPEFLSQHQLGQLFPGIDRSKLEAVMGSRGYVRQYQMGVGEIWVKTGEGTGGESFASATSGGLDARGRPEFVDPTLLEPGERVTSQSGLTFVGGTDYTDPSGNTVSQYSITLPGGANDTKGRYKWSSTIRKDEQGNWVRIYRKELRKVYTRSHRNRAQGRREARRNQQNQVNGNEVNQLVNLRVDFG